MLQWVNVYTPLDIYDKVTQRYIWILALTFFILGLALCTMLNGCFVSEWKDYEYPKANGPIQEEQEEQE